MGCFEKAEPRGSHPPQLKNSAELRKPYTTFYYEQPTNFKLQLAIEQRVRLVS